jgi:hypothetical protein
MIIRTNLSNEDSDIISIENIDYNFSVTFHLTHSLRNDHIPGYYLIRFDNDGLARFNDVGYTDSNREVIRSIETDEDQKLKIIGVDEI